MFLIILKKLYQKLLSIFTIKNNWLKVLCQPADIHLKYENDSDVLPTLIKTI